MDAGCSCRCPLQVSWEAVCQLALILTNGIDMEIGWRLLTHIIPILVCLWYPAVSPISLSHLEKWQIIGNKCPFQKQERHLLNESAFIQMVR